MQISLEEARDAALAGGAIEAYAEYFNGGTEIGVTFEKGGGRHAIRHRVDDPFGNEAKETEEFVRSWLPQTVAEAPR